MKDKLYRNDRLQTAYRETGATFRGVYAATGLTPATQRAALSGDAVQLEKLKAFADYLQIEWHSLFEIKKDGKK